MTEIFIVSDTWEVNSAIQTKNETQIRVQYWKSACIRNKNCFVVSFIWKLFQKMVQQICKNNNKLFEEWHHIFLLFRSSFSKWAFQLSYRHFCSVKKERSKSPHLKTDFFSQEIPHWKGQPSLFRYIWQENKHHSF